MPLETGRGHRRISGIGKWWRLAVFAALLYGCATLPTPEPSVHSGSDTPLGRCGDLFASLDEAAAESGVLDAATFRIPGHPYLRTSRFLASFHDRVTTTGAFTAWVARMRQLDLEGRRYEIANLPPEDIDDLTGSPELMPTVDEPIRSCGDLMLAEDVADGSDKEVLTKASAVPDEYLDARRVLGVYPFTAVFISLGVSKWQEEARITFSNLPPEDGDSIRYLPDTDRNVNGARRILAQAKKDLLGIPIYSEDETAALFRAYAPVWEVRTRGDYDRIGTPSWTHEGELRIDTSLPVTYTKLTFTRFGERIFTQLNYAVWFPERPKTNVLDLYGGDVDGVLYRVTLDEDGNPLLAETIHHCGCYYKVYPARRLIQRDPIELDEPPLILSVPDGFSSANPMTIALDTGTHYVQHVYETSRKPAGIRLPYRFADFDDLRSLPVPGGKRKSLFNAHGLVEGSQRLERFVLWPAGVLSPGAMRQLGRQAITLIGKRHFDDPFDLEKMFVVPGR